MMRRLEWLLVAGAVALAGCNGAGDDDDDGSSNPTVFEFRTGGFEIPPGTEFYHCFIVKSETGGTASDEVGARRFAYTAGSAGLHHIVIFSDPGDEAEGDRSCDVFENAWEVRYAGGTVTDPLDMPSGVAMPVRPVETWVIQFHYLNAGSTPIYDDTTVEITYTEPGESFIPAGLVVAGNTDFEIPASTTGHEVVGVCQAPAGTPDLNVFAVWPHMHQYGRHFKVEHNRGGNTNMLIDAAWAFADQPMWRYDTPVVFGAGDTVTTTCTYDNNTTAIIPFGESSTQEMCFDVFFYYPRPSFAPAMVPCL